MAYEPLPTHVFFSFSAPFDSAWPCQRPGWLVPISSNCRCCSTSINDNGIIIAVKLLQLRSLWLLDLPECKSNSSGRNAADLPKQP